MGSLSDDERAKFRMRALRASHGGATLYDRARQYAIRRLIAAHRDEFDRYRTEFIAAVYKAASLT